MRNLITFRHCLLHSSFEILHLNHMTSVLFCDSLFNLCCFFRLFYTVFLAFEEIQHIFFQDSAIFSSSFYIFWVYLVLTQETSNGRRCLNMSFAWLL